MSDSKIITNGSAGGHRLLTLKEAMETSPDYRAIDHRLLAKVNPGHYVKVWIEALNMKKPAAGEIVWVKVVYRQGQKFKGEIRNQTSPKRALLHGLKFLDIIEFKMAHILNLRMEDLDNADKLRVFGIE